ncbi:hypothetical protein A0256_22830 [Mucilaginibacter sp. PAMC 26640]|nr:hypothetical protein A0256_22830 [Mucilaginibacter sp. PAMC 26640]
MKKQKIALFTAHSPVVGGGGAILRSLVPNLPQLDITWYYLNPQTVPGYEQGYLGQPLMGGAILQDILQTRKMLAGNKVVYLDNIIDQLLAVDCDAYWVVSHNEGLRIALELSIRQQWRPVHMTVHDDWAGALCARSVRYRVMNRLAQKLTIKTLKAVASFDVISSGMRDYYRTLTARRGEICHRYLPERSICINGETKEKDGIRIGHIGSIYDKKDLFKFLELLKSFFTEKGKPALLQMWGCHLSLKDVPRHLREYIEFFETLPEEKVISRLAACDFVYCMYPLTKTLHTFSKTSLPTKLTSYLQAARPVFGHGPDDSTLAEFLNTTKLGAMWSTQGKKAGFTALENIMALKTTGADWQDARRQYFGEKNLQVISKAMQNTPIF